MKKNVVMIVVDQLRYDSLGSHDLSGCLSTPYLDDLATKGVDFQSAYSTVPTCIPARASLLTGLKAEKHGRVGYQDGVPWTYQKTLASEFGAHGYQTEAIGKMHVYPDRNRVGFDHVLLHNGYLHESRKTTKSVASQFAQSDDYLTWLQQQKGCEVDLIDDGLDCNSWVARPWMYEENLHPTNWVSTEGIRFLKRRDPTVPFFLKLSYTRPHAPLNPPSYYFEMYLQQLANLPTTNIGSWEEGLLTKEIDAKKGRIADSELKRSKAAYYGLITHLDHQIGRFLMALGEADLEEETVIMFVSDHGDQLGDHYLFRKGYPYQESIHIPLIVYDPTNSQWQGQQSHELVELRDVFPTLIGLATGAKVSEIDGINWQNPQEERFFLHGEHLLGEDSSQYILDQHYKYIWLPWTNQFQLFDLKKDPGECHNVINDQAYAGVSQKYHDLLIQELLERPEQYVLKGQLVQRQISN